MKEFALILFALVSFRVVGVGEVEARSAVRRLAKQKPVKPPRRDRPPRVKNPQVPVVVCPAVRRVDGSVDIMAAICEGRRQLASFVSEPRYCTTVQKVRQCSQPPKPKRGRRRGSVQRQHVCKMVEVKKTRVCGATVGLALLDPRTGVVTRVETDERGEDPADHDIKINGPSRGVATEYVVRVPPGMLVVGLRRIVRSSRGGFAQATYVPASEALLDRFPELVGIGWRYLVGLFAHAEQTLQDAGVAYDRVPREVLMALVFVEHFSRPGMSLKEVPGEIRRVLGTFALNGPETYRYAVSSAKARGVGQFMPSTWGRLQRRYATLLDEDFVKGSTNHRQMAVGMYLLTNADLDHLFRQNGWRGNAAHQQAHLQDWMVLGGYLAAAYNGGSPRAARWELGGRQMGLLAAETRGYVPHFKMAWWYMATRRLASQGIKPWVVLMCYQLQALGVTLPSWAPQPQCPEVLRCRWAE